MAHLGTLFYHVAHCSCDVPVTLNDGGDCLFRSHPRGPWWRSTRTGQRFLRSRTRHSSCFLARLRIPPWHRTFALLCAARCHQIVPRARSRGQSRFHRQRRADDDIVWRQSSICIRPCADRGDDRRQHRLHPQGDRSGRHRDTAQTFVATFCCFLHRQLALQRPWRRRRQSTGRYRRSAACDKG